MAKNIKRGLVLFLSAVFLCAMASISVMATADHGFSNEILLAPTDEHNFADEITLVLANEIILATEKDAGRGGICYSCEMASMVPIHRNLFEVISSSHVFFPYPAPCYHYPDVPIKPGVTLIDRAELRQYYDVFHCTICLRIQNVNTYQSVYRIHISP